MARLDQEMVELEKRPGDGGLLASIFRTIHTIKGTCGFLGFTRLESITHYAENLLSLLRNGELVLTPDRVSLILETVDATRRELVSIEASGAESGQEYDDLRQRLQRAAVPDATSETGAIRPPESVEPAPAGVPLPQQTPAPQESDEAEASAAAGAPPAPAPAQSEPARSDDSGSSTRAPSAADSTIRVDVGLLGKLMNLVGELVLARNQILQYTARQEDPQLSATSQRLNLITTQLQEGVMKTRMQPIGMIWGKLPRVVRDLAAACGKHIRLEMDGADTELDKSIIEAIKDPLTHIVRNCCDHGIERPEIRAACGKPAEGTLVLRAFHEGGQVNIEIIDDGGGIHPAKIKAKAVQKGLIRPEQAEAMSDREAASLVFLPGFSTAEQVTNISGRGVGMDVVKTNIEKIGGSVDLVSRAGEGTTVRLKIPLTLAIIPGIVVRCASQRFVIPQVSLLELLRLEGEAQLAQIERIHGAPVYRRRGRLLPLIYLNEVLQLPGAPDVPGVEKVISIVVLQAEERQFGLVVDGVNDTQEIVVKPLGKQLKGMNCYAGATIMGDGKVALILDVMGLGHRSKVLAEVPSSSRTVDVAAESSNLDRQSLLLFKAGNHERLAVPLALVARLEEFGPERIEQANERSVIQYRGHILPLVPLGPMLDPGVPDLIASGSPAPVVVFGDGDRAVGVVVDQIIDIVETEVAVRRRYGGGLLFGSAVVGDKVTEFLDLPMVGASCGTGLFGTPEGQRTPLTVLVATGSIVSAGMARAYLEMAGHRVREAHSVADAIRQSANLRFDAVLVGYDLPGSGDRAGAVQLLDHLRNTPSYSGVPLIALTGHETVPVEGAFDAFESGFDRDSIINSLENLAGSVGRTSSGVLATQ